MSTTKKYRVFQAHVLHAHPRIYKNTDTQRHISLLIKSELVSVRDETFAPYGTEETPTTATALARDRKIHSKQRETCQCPRTEKQKLNIVHQVFAWMKL